MTGDKEEVSDHDSSTVKENASRLRSKDSLAFVGAELPILENLDEESCGSEDRWRSCKSFRREDP